MSLNETPTIFQWPATHYVFLEGIGPFQETAPRLWQSLPLTFPKLDPSIKIKKFLSLYKIRPQMLYRAGIAVEAKPGTLPDGLRYEYIPGGQYSCFTLTGSYMQLPEACGRVFEIIEKTKLALRDDFFMEHYLNDPKTTPENELLTEILIPTL